MARAVHYGQWSLGSWVSLKRLLNHWTLDSWIFPQPLWIKEQPYFLLFLHPEVVTHVKAEAAFPRCLPALGPRTITQAVWGTFVCLLKQD